MGLAPRSYGSAFPCVQDVLFGCRAKGLGASITTMRQAFEEEMIELSGIPTRHDIVAVLPVAYPKYNFGPLTRKPSADKTHLDRWRPRRSYEISGIALHLQLT